MTKQDKSMESFEMGMASHWKMILWLICPHSDARADEAMGHWGSKTRYMGSKSSVGDRDIQIRKSTLSRQSRGISAGRGEQRAGREKACKQTVQTIIFAKIFGRPSFILFLRESLNPKLHPQSLFHNCVLTPNHSKPRAGVSQLMSAQVPHAKDQAHSPRIRHQVLIDVGALP